MNSNSLENLVINNLKVIKFYDVKNKNSRWECECLLCGGIKIITRPNILSGNTKDCGCRRNEKISKANIKHNKSKSGAYYSWNKMKQRIRLGEKHSPIYGNIELDEKWNNFNAFYIDMGDRPKGCTLDRIDNKKGYNKENCRWATPKQQSRNRGSNKVIEYQGKSMCIVEWSEYLNIHRSTIARRLKKNLPLDLKPNGNIC